MNTPHVSTPNPSNPTPTVPPAKLERSRPKITILDMYIVGEVLPMLAGGLLIVIVTLVMGALFERIGAFLAKGANPILVAQYLAFRLPEMLSLGLPIALLFAVLMSLSRLTQDSELKAAVVAGISPTRLTMPVLIIGAVVALIAFINAETLQPRGIEQASRVLRDIIISNPRVAFTGGQFFKDAQNQVIYLPDGGLKDGGILENITIMQGSEGQVPLSIMRAPKGKILADQGAIELTGGSRITYRAGDARPVTIAHFARAVIPIKDLQQGSNLSQKPIDLPLPTLLERIKSYQSQGFRINGELTALNQKFAKPLASVAFALFGIALSLYTLRSNQSLGFVGVMFLTFFYYATWTVFNVMGESGAIPAVIAAWTPDLLYAGAGVALLTLARRR